jgi:hypothetical protein
VSVKVLSTERTSRSLRDRLRTICSRKKMRFLRFLKMSTYSTTLTSLSQCRDNCRRSQDPYCESVSVAQNIGGIGMAKPLKSKSWGKGAPPAAAAMPRRPPIIPRAAGGGGVPSGRQTATYHTGSEEQQACSAFMFTFLTRLSTLTHRGVVRPMDAGFALVEQLFKTVHHGL